LFSIFEKTLSAFLYRTFLLTLLAVRPALAQPQLIDKVVGVVDDRMILWSQIETQYQQYAYQNQTSLPPDFRCQLLAEALTDKLLVHQAEIDSVTVTEEEVEAKLEQNLRAFANAAGSMEKLEEYYGKSVVEIKDEFRDEIRDRLISQKERETIIRDVKVTPSDVVSFYNEIPKDSLPYFNSQLQVGVLIIYPKVNAQVKDYSRQKILDLLARVKKGEDFAALASAYSDDPGSAELGGELGFINRGETDPEFEAAAFALKQPNEISNVVESQFGFHIIQLMERRGDRIRLRHILVKPKITSADVAAAANYADSIYQLIQKGSISFEQAVGKFSEDDQTKGSGGLLINQAYGDATEFEPADLAAYDQALVPITDTLQVGAVSQPAAFRTRQGTSGFRLVYLKSRTPPHQANLQDDYSRMQEMALTKKQFETIDRWLRDRIARSYVFIAPEYRSCKVLQKWINNSQQ
jgi:peptidyl-prolyl cis-trans isomerase SurA